MLTVNLDENYINAIVERRMNEVLHKLSNVFPERKHEIMRVLNGPPVKIEIGETPPGLSSAFEQLTDYEEILPAQMRKAKLHSAFDGLNPAHQKQFKFVGEGDSVEDRTQIPEFITGFYEASETPSQTDEEFLAGVDAFIAEQKQKLAEFDREDNYDRAMKGTISLRK